VAANGTAYYLDVNGATPGFGDPANMTYAYTGNYWTTNSAGTDTPGGVPVQAQYTFGYAGTAGISNGVFSFTGNNHMRGIIFNVPCTATLSSFGYFYATEQQLWSVPVGTILNIAQNNGNWNNVNALIQGGGTINITGTSFGKNSGNYFVQDMTNGTVNLQAGYTATENQPSYKLLTGTLNFATVSSASALGSKHATGHRVQFYGGTLDNTSGSAMTLDIGNARYEIGGSFTFAGTSSLNLNTNAVDLKAGTQTITVSANTLTFGGAITNSGAIVKAGAGTLALSANNTYSGATTINAGTLLGVTGGSCSNSAVTVAATSGNTAMLNISVTDTTKQWTCSSLTVNNAGISSGMQFAFGAVTPSTTLAPLKASASVTFSTAPAITVSGTSLPLSSGNGYPLVTWGSGSPTTNGVALTLPLRVVGNLAVVGNTLYLQVTGNTGPLSWTGGDGTWDINNSGNATIWKDNTSVNTYYQEGASMDSVLFDTTVGTGGTITLNTNVSPNSVTVNASSNYTFSGSGGIAGTAGLIKSGTGMLTLNTRNTYSGATTINAGTLLIAVGNSCSNSAVSVAATAGNTAILSVAVTNTAQQWVCAALTVNNAGVTSGLDFNFGALTPSTTVAPLKIAGTVTFTTLPTVTVELGNVGAAGTQYPLMTWGSGSVIAPTNLIVNALRGLVTHLTVSGTTLYLVVDVVNGTPYYLDVNGVAAGFGDPSGSYDETTNVWSTASSGTAAPGTLPTSSQLTFGYPGTAGISNSSISIATSHSPWSGYVINVPCAVTLTGGGYCGSHQTWVVTQGASLTLAGYWNFNGMNVTLQGGGIVNDNGYMGFNCLSSTIKQDMAGGTVNLLKAWVNGASNQITEKQANYTLQRGTLNFATAASASAFGATNPVSRTVAFNGGTLDNTSGAAITLNVGSANYSIGGSFTFAGSSSLTLTNTVNLGTVTPTVTVSQNTLTVGGAITNTAGLAKAGAGTLVLSGNNTYSGGTTVGGGTLLVDGGITGAVNVVGGVLGGTGTVGGVVTNVAAITAAGTNSIGTLTTAGLVMKENSTCIWNYNDTTNDMIQVNGSLTLPAVATVAVTRVTSGRIPARGILFNGFSSIVTNTGTLSGWVITGAMPNTFAQVEGNQVVLVTRPIGTMVRIF
jgi:autotransporter-associated beta strand protein